MHMYAHTHHGGSEFPFPIRLWFGAVRIHNLGNEVLDRVSATSRVESLSFFALRFSMSSMPGGQPEASQTCQAYYGLTATMSIAH